MTSRNDPLWQRYELTVRDCLAAFDPSAMVRHNVRVTGLSTVKRQVDVYATGKIVGVDISVAIECKRHSRPVDIQLIDQFVGKLLDIGADRGILYSYEGFTDNAVLRAGFARNPYVMPIALKTPDIVRQLQGVPGYPARLLAQDVPPLWADQLDPFDYAHFLQSGEWIELAM